MDELLYLDTAATTPVRREVLETMWPYLTGEFGNPSSNHQLGERAAHAVQAARATVAEQLGCRPSEVVFTSGGTEADNLAVKGIALGDPRGRHLVTTPIEHEAVQESADYLRRLHGFEVTELPVDGEGLVDPEALAGALRPDTTLVSIQHASNEVGTVQDIPRLAEIARAAGVPFHTDAVQSAGWIPVGLASLGVDALSPHFVLELSKRGRMDCLHVRIERHPATGAEQARAAGAELKHRMKVHIGITAEVIVEDPGALPRSEGKQCRVYDHR